MAKGEGSVNGKKRRIGFVGAGTVGSLLANSLHSHGYPVAAVASARHASAERLASAVHATACDHAQQVADASDIVFITTPDDAIEKTAAAVRWLPRHNAVHCSGALTVAVLGPVTRAGGQVAGFHPMQTFTAGGRNSLSGVTVAIEGEGALQRELAGIAAELGCPAIAVKSSDKAMYHLSGVLASNYVVTLYQTAVQVLEEIGVPSNKAGTALLTLLEGVASNIAMAGLPAALTGPIARGDAGTISRHLDELRRRSPELLPLYEALGRETVPIAAAKGIANVAALERILNLLGAEQPERPLAFASQHSLEVS